MKLISRQAFEQYMEHRGLTVRALADKAGISPALVGHLRSGKRSTCRPKNAAAIEKALNAPPGSLFVAQMSYVVHGSGRAA